METWKLIGLWKCRPRCEASEIQLVFYIPYGSSRQRQKREERACWHPARSQLPQGLPLTGWRAPTDPGPLCPARSQFPGRQLLGPSRENRKPVLPSF